MIQRDEHKSEFVRVAWSTLRDERLSFEARGFLAFLLTFPDDWEFNYNGLSSMTGLSEKTIMRLVKELKTAGYISQKKRKNGAGHFYSCEWTICESSELTKNGSSVKPKFSKTEVPSNRSSDEPNFRKRGVTTNEISLTNEIKKEKAAPFSAQLEPLSPEIRAVFEEFIKMRKKIKAPLTEKALELAIKKAFNLAQNDPEMVKAIVEQSIMKSWRGLFELKDESAKKSAIPSGNPFLALAEQEGLI